MPLLTVTSGQLAGVASEMRVRGGSQRRSEGGLAAVDGVGAREGGQDGCRIERRGVNVPNMDVEWTRRRVLRSDEEICGRFKGQRGRDEESSYTAQD
jgi:hypothetical protein